MIPVIKAPGHMSSLLLTSCFVDKLLDFFAYHLHSADDHYVRWKWTVGAVAIWDNRCVLHRVIPGTYNKPRRGIRTTVFGEKRKSSLEFFLLALANSLKRSTILRVKAELSVRRG